MHELRVDPVCVCTQCPLYCRSRGADSKLAGMSVDQFMASCLDDSNHDDTSSIAVSTIGTKRQRR